MFTEQNMNILIKRKTPTNKCRSYDENKPRDEGFNFWNDAVKCPPDLNKTTV